MSRYGLGFEMFVILSEIEYAEWAELIMLCAYVSRRSQVLYLAECLHI